MAVRPIDADELEMFPYSEGAGTEEQISEWIEQTGLSEDDTASRARDLCWKVIEGFINVVKTQPTLTQPPITGDTSDGYHTFNELYRHRAILFSVICNERPDVAWKSKRHHDGTMYDGMFIVGIDTPEGQATYHYDIEPYWNLFRVKELELAPEWDGHTPGEAIRRIGTLTQPNEWVSVYDRLPEPGERVLATDCGFVGEFYINKRGKWQRYNVNCSELLMALDILYWMPLPAPPDRRPPEGEEEN